MKLSKILRKCVVIVMTFCFFLCSILALCSNAVEAATGINMGGLTIKGYPYSNSNFAVYNSTGTGRYKIGTCYGASDLITISAVGTDGWSKITYPAGSRYKTGYCQTSYLFQNTNFKGDRGRVERNITTYRKSNCSASYGTSTTGDIVFITGYANGNTQIVYPCSGYYKIAWIKGNYRTENGILTNAAASSYNPQGYFDSVVSNSNNQITVKGWGFDRDNLNSQIQIHVYVGGAAGSGATGYSMTANTYRPDVNTYFSGEVGNYHGFSNTFTVNKTGNQSIYVYAINISGGTNVFLGAKTVNIKTSSGNTGSTSNARQRLVKYASSQIGVGDYKGNNNVIYNKWYYGRTISGSGYAWCQAFVSYCAYKCGLLNTYIPRECNCQRAVNWFKNKGRFYKSKYYGGNYTPKAGDIAFYTSNKSTACHVGIITASPVNGYLQVVEGNVYSSNGNYKVVKFTGNSKRRINNSYVLGYGVPNY